MGPSLVATMIQADAEGPQAKKLHPFFTRPSDAPIDAPSYDDPTPHDPNEAHEEAPFLQDPEGADGGKKRLSGEAIAMNDAPATKRPRRKRTSARTSLNESIMSHLTRPANAEPATELENQPSDNIPTPPLSDISNRTTDPAMTSEQTEPKQPQTPQPVAKAPSQTSPNNKKVLKFNPRTGTLGSPPKPKQNTPPSRIVTIKYGSDSEGRSEMGRRIKEILETPQAPRSRPRRGRPPKRAKKTEVDMTDGDLDSPGVKMSSNSNVPDPKSKGTPSELRKKSPPPKRHTITMATPVSPRKQRTPFDSKRIANFGGMKPIGTKIPGAKHPTWPSQDSAHIRGVDELSPFKHQPFDDVVQPRKFKGQVVNVKPEDSIVEQLAQQLDVLSVRNHLTADDNLPMFENLRLPERRFESGRKLQSRIRKQLRAPVRFSTSEGPQDDLAEPLNGLDIHPAISQLYKDLETSLSAFDQSTCENCVWAQKYAPRTADQVLQIGKEVIWLKEWLEASKVQAVDTGSTENGSGSGTSKGEKPPKKRRKNKLDGFIVTSDSEEDDLEEGSDDEPSCASGTSQHPKSWRKKTKRRFRNVVVMSGPHGSGKTAAVYAVAQELGFEIFEINSASRRSGKDLLERVGDMTKNHLVQQAGAGASATEADAEDEVSKDLKSGKQATMASFFKPKGGAQASTNQEKSRDERKPEPKSKSQKQSLILLEEVDVLYEEDKQFWTTLMSMIAQSKRPFIMTCNDETLIPTQNLALHGELYFSPPPAQLATDACLLMAANEGHSLERSAVEALYLSRGNDLRATIMELNYWCQLGVGDKRGGFDWFYLRWPKGSDLDENGDIVRVVSEKTYVKGMGWLARDLITSRRDSQEEEEEALHQCWESWQLAAGDWHDTLDMASCTRDLSTSDSKSRLTHDLSSYVQFSEVLSDADLCCNSAFGAHLQDLVDPSLPKLPDKARDDFVLGRQLLEADPLSRSVALDREISISLASLARQGLYKHVIQVNEPVASEELRPVQEDKAVSILESSFKNSPDHVTRYDMALAFDPIAASGSKVPVSYLDPSVFDRTMKLIVLDVAPWVRSIVSYDDQLMHERKKLSSLLSEGGGQKKRSMRNTRAAYSALEGGERKSTRRNRYFDEDVNPSLVMRTGLKSWQDAMREVMALEEEPDSPAASNADDTGVMDMD